MTVGDVYYVLFRHKWKIVLLSLAGILAAAAFRHFNPPPYQSQAELLIQYVPQAPTLSMIGGDQKIVVPGGDDVINAEIQILSSLDLAEEAATNIGPAAILAKAGGGSNSIAAAGLIRGNLEVATAGDRSSVLVVTFKHPDAQIVQPVLQELINDYFKKHKEIHSAGGQYDNALNQEVTAVGAQLRDTDKQLTDLKNNAKIISVDATGKNLADQISKIQGAILDANAELAGYAAAMKQPDGAPAEKPETTNVQTAIPRDQIAAYNDIIASLDALRKREQGFLLQGFTASNTLVQEVDALIAGKQQAKSGLEEKYPQIAGLQTVSPSAGRTVRNTRGGSAGAGCPSRGCSG